MTVGKRAACASLLLLATMPLLAADAPRPDDYAYGWTLRVDRGDDFYRVPLSREVLAAALSRDLDDVAVFDDDGRAVPAFLHVPQTVTAPEPATYELRGFAVAERARAAAGAGATTVVVETGGASGARTAVRIEPGSAEPDAPEALRWYAVVDEAWTNSAALELAWTGGDGNFVHGVDLETSDDLESWYPVAHGAIAEFRAGDSHLAFVRDRIELGGALARFVRITVQRPSAGFELTKLQLREAKAVSEPQRETQTQDLIAGSIQQVIDLGAMLAVDRFDVRFLDSNGMVRTQLESAPAAEGPWTPRSGGLFFRIENGSEPVNSNAVKLGGAPARYWRVTLVGHGGAPLQVELGWIPVELIFIGQGTRPFQLVAGNAAQANDAQHMRVLRNDARALWEAQRPPTADAALGPRHELAGSAALDPDPSRDWKSIVLWLLLGGGVLVVLLMVLRLRRELVEG